MQRWDDLLSAMASAQKLEPPPDQIVIVIDHNLEMKARAEAEFPGIRVIENAHPQ
jgi:hypothetical protein